MIAKVNDDYKHDLLVYQINKKLDKLKLKDFKLSELVELDALIEKIIIKE